MQKDPSPHGEAQPPTSSIVGLSIECPERNERGISRSDYSFSSGA